MRVIVAGTRTLDEEVAFEEISQTFLEIACESPELGEPKGHIILSGCSGAVDREAIRFARISNWPCRRYPADWETHGKAAGPIRNEEMAKNADTLILIWNGRSRGSADMKRRAETHGLKIYERLVGDGGA